MTARKTAPREVFYRTLLLVLSVSAALLMAEAGLRVIYAVDHGRNGTLQEQLERSRQTDLEEVGNTDRLGGLVQASVYHDVIYELKPNLRGAFLRRKISVNSAGFRDREYSLEKPPGTFRIVGLGDSVMFGWRLLEEQTYLAVLEKWLGERASSLHTFEVLNFAVPGYNTAIETAVFEHKALPFQPDLVVIHFVSNDTGLPKFMQRRPDPQSLDRSYLLDLVRTRFGLGLGALEREERLVGYRLKDVESEEEKREISSRYQHMTGRSGFGRAMDRLGELTASRGIPVLLLVGSTRKGQRSAIEQTAERNGFHTLFISPVTKRVFAENGIPTDKKTMRRKLRVLPGDSHPNAFGHYIYAVGLWEKLQEIGVVAPAPTPPPPPSVIP